MITTRSALAKGWTFARFAVQQFGNRARVAREIAAAEAVPFAFEAPTITLKASDPDWMKSGLHVRAGERFALSARGAIWPSRALAIAIEGHATLFVRIAGRIAKPAGADHVFTAWADGEVELFLKGFSEWASPAGDLLSAARGGALGEVHVRVKRTADAETGSSAPPGYRYLWRLGDGAIYSANKGQEIAIRTHGDVGILQTEIDHPLTPNTRLEWSWRVERLPSRLPEDLQMTHDYLSVAVEFENGKDLTFMWSAGLPKDHIFACPLSFWCDWETHWVIRNPSDGLGTWHAESRNLWDDTTRAYGARPARAVRLWLIANSIFQRNDGIAAVRNLRLTEGA